MLSAILVDDMPSALDLLRGDIEAKHPELEVIGTAQSVVEAAKLLRKKQPDILFLDIMLGDGSGFDVLEIFPDIRSKIIFVTASDQYAIRAFKFAAIDYVLKPYSEEELASAIQRAKQQIQPDRERLDILKNTLSAPDQQPSRISLHTLDKIIIVNLEDIVRCESDSNNTSFYFHSGERVLVTKTLKYFADMLKSCQFIRVHQSHLVNLAYINAFIKTDGGYILMKNGDKIPVSVRKRGEIVELLTKHP